MSPSSFDQIVYGWDVSLAALDFRLLRFDAFVGEVASPRPTPRSLLLLAWLFPPTISGGVYRPTALLKYGGDHGWSCTVIAGPAAANPTPAGQYLLEQIPSDVRIERVRARQEAWGYSVLPRIDGGALNVVEAYRTARQIFGKARPSIVLGSGPPFHNFVAATLLARRFRSKLVLEYRDEWSESPFPWVADHPDNRRLEAWCLSRADRVIFTTAAQLSHQVERFRVLDADRCVVLPNGWDPDDFRGLPLREDRSHDKFVLAYFGNFGAMGDPADWLSDLAAVLAQSPELRAQFVFRVYGQKAPDALAQLKRFPYQECLELIDQVPKKEACGLMAAADALLVLNPPSLSRYIQGKLFDYVASGTPILLHGGSGEMGNIVKQEGVGVALQIGDRTALRETLVHWRARSNRSTASRIDAWLKRHSRERIAHETFALLESL